MISPEGSGQSAAPVPEQVAAYCGESLIGAGAAATVYRAHPMAAAAGDTPQTVALKLLKPEAMTQPQVLASFQFERLTILFPSQSSCRFRAAWN